MALPLNVQNAPIYNANFNKPPTAVDSAQVLPFTLPFNGTDDLEINLQSIVGENTSFSFIKSVYVDNSLNSETFSLFVAATRQTLTWPAYSQGYMPLLSTNPPLFTASTDGALNIDIHFLAFVVPPVIWQPPGIVATTTISGNVNVVSAGGNNTDASANAPALLGTTLLTIAANAARKYVEIQNQSDVDIQVALDSGSGTPTIIVLGNGGAAGLQGGGWSSTTFKGRVRVLSAAAGKQIAAYEI